MAKSTQPAWAGKLRKQLKRAGEEDRDLSRFGADQHEYQLKPPASAEAVAAFEARFLLWRQELQPKLLFVGGFHLLGEIPLDKCHPVSSRLQPVEEPTPLPAPLGVINHPFAVNQTHY